MVDDGDPGVFIRHDGGLEGGTLGPVELRGQRRSKINTRGKSTEEQDVQDLQC